MWKTKRRMFGEEHGMTIEDLKNYGANTEEGLARCMNNEGMYLRLVGMALSNPGFERLGDEIASGDPKPAFETAHALKGMLGNLSLMPLYEPVSTLTEMLRGKGPGEDVGDWKPLYDEIMKQFEALKALA